MYNSIITPNFPPYFPQPNRSMALVYALYYRPMSVKEIIMHNYVLKNSMAPLGVPRKAVRPLANKSILSNIE